MVTKIELLHEKAKTLLKEDACHNPLHKIKGESEKQKKMEKNEKTEII